MAEDNILEVGGYLFASSSDAQAAENEQKGVEYLRKRTSLSNPRKVLTVYNKMVSEGIFQTPVGIGYMKELQDFLTEHKDIDNNSIKKIPMGPMGDHISKKKMMDKITHLFSNSKTGYRERLRISVGVNLVLAAVILAMFVIAATGDNVNILNYEEKLIDRYAAWEQELTDRENAVRALEK